MFTVGISIFRSTAVCKPTNRFTNIFTNSFTNGFLSYVTTSNYFEKALYPYLRTTMKGQLFNTEFMITTVYVFIECGAYQLYCGV